LCRLLRVVAIVCMLQPSVSLPGSTPPAQAFLSMFWHVEWALEAGVQAAMLAVVIRENEAICTSPASASGQGVSWQAGLPPLLSFSWPCASLGPPDPALRGHTLAP
jgi:hypothetical protein